MPQNLFGTATPALPDLTDGTDIALGTLFAPGVNGTATYGRWRFPNNIPHASTPVQVGIYRVSDSALLGSVSFPLGATLGAWNEVAFSSAISLVAGVQYMVVVWSPGRYVATNAYPWPVVSGDLTTPTNAGRYLGSTGGLAVPTNSFNNSSYFPDLVFEPTAGGSVLAVSGAATASPAAAGSLTLRGAVAGAATTTPAASGALTLRMAVTGAATATPAASGSLTRLTPITGAATVTPAAAGTLTITTGSQTYAVAGAAAAIPSAAAALTLRAALTGAAIASPSATGGLTLQAVITGSAVATPAASGVLALRALFAGAASTVPSALGSLTIIGPPGAITLRPSTGTTGRPYAGITARP